MKLGDASKILIGVLLNREENKNGGFKYRLFNLKKYEDNLEYGEFYTDKNLDEKLTQVGDILFRLVAPNKIINIENASKDLLVPSQLCIIRPDTKILNPIFLKWYLESNAGKEKIAMELSGSSIQKMSINSLRNIDIPIIDIEKQNQIEDLIELWGKEKKILQLSIENKENLYNDIIEEIIEKEVKD